MGNLSRESNIQTDEYGVDPLKDRGFIAIKNVLKYENFTVTSDVAGRPDLISDKYYNTVDLWWVILAFNGISDVRGLTSGVIIKVPNYSELISKLTETKTVINQSSSVTI